MGQNVQTLRHTHLQNEIERMFGDITFNVKNPQPKILPSFSFYTYHCCRCRLLVVVGVGVSVFNFSFFFGSCLHILGADIQFFSCSFFYLIPFEKSVVLPEHVLHSQTNSCRHHPHLIPFHLMQNQI